MVSEYLLPREEKILYEFLIIMNHRSTFLVATSTFINPSKKSYEVNMKRLNRGLIVAQCANILIVTGLDLMLMLG
jgi:hypothetical protein